MFPRITKKPKDMITYHKKPEHDGNASKKLKKNNSPQVQNNKLSNPYNVKKKFPFILKKTKLNTSTKYLERKTQITKKFNTPRDNQSYYVDVSSKKNNPVLHNKIMDNNLLYKSPPAI